MNNKVLNTPKDVPMQYLEVCQVLENDSVIFEGIDCAIEQKIVVSSISHDIFSGREIRERKEVILRLKGVISKYLSNKFFNSSETSNVSFLIKYKRTDILEIFKHGQFISISGVGCIEDIEDVHGDEIKKEDCEDCKYIVTGTLVISVSGELKIK